MTVDTRRLALILAAGLSVLTLAAWWWLRPPQPVRVSLIGPPVVDAVPAIDGDRAVLISGRRVTPAGRVIRTQSYSWGMAVSPDESRVALIRSDAIEIIDLRGAAPSVRIPPYGVKPDPSMGEGAYMGCAFSPDGRLLYFGSADTGEIKAFDLTTSRVVLTIPIDGGGFRDSFIGDFVLNAAGTEVYALDQFNYRLVTIDLPRRAVVRSVRVGRNPFAVSLSPDGRRAWVSNVGMFEYPLLPGVTEENRQTAGLTFPAYGVPSRAAEEGTTTEGLQVPGLGSPNHPDAMSVFGVDLATAAVMARVKTGYLVGAERDGVRTIGGASPGGVAAGGRHVYVSNATNDTISILDAASGAIAGQINLDVPGLERWRGVLPFGLALSPDERRLYVACAGLNAVAVIDAARRAVEGFIPAGWFTSSVAVSRDGRTLFVSSAKGLGSGPNGGRGFVAPARGLHPGDIMQGTLQVVPVPDAAGLARHTRQVLENTFTQRETVLDAGHPLRAGLAGGAAPGPIRHVVFVVKENRTFDQVFGQRRGVDGDASLTTLGLGMSVRSEDGSRVLDRADVSPNHHALADRFAISDNFFCDADQSNTGHRWVAGVYPNEWVEVNARSRIEARLFSPAPGRRYVSGSKAVVMPEDYNEAGALWEHLDRHAVPFFNFGFGTEMPAALEEQAFKETGIRMAVSFPLPKPLFDRTSRRFATYNMAIPDQYRMDMFEEELRDRWLSGKEPFPRLITLVLPNDHLTDEHPDDGYPFAESYMADNDLALGRLLHTLSRTRWWKDMLVVVTEDDPQGGRDHVEAHRSLLLLIGPHVKRGYVSHTLTDFGSLMRLIFTVLGLPPLNHFDAAASLPLDMFTTGPPDTAPYTVIPPDRRLFDPDLAFKPFDRRFNWKQLGASARIDEPEDMRRPFTELTSALAPVVMGAAAPLPRDGAVQAESRRIRVSHVARALQPGEVVLVRVTTASPADTVTGESPAGSLHFSRAADPLAWEALMGLDLAAKPGPLRLSIHETTAGVGTDARYDLTVAAKTFPARRITVDERFVNPPASELPRIEREAKRTAAILAVVSPARLWSGPFIPPVPGAATSSFGRISIINGQRGSPHAGTDFQAAIGTPIKAPNAGTVVLSDSMYYSGDTVIIDHGLGVYSYLAHMSRRDVAVGDHVDTGSTVGLSGVTGRITGPHLHLSVRVAGARVDPMSLLEVLGGGPERPSR